MKENRRILIIAILPGMFIWFLDAIVDYFLLKGPFLKVFLFDVSPEKVCIRALFFIYFLVMAFVLSWLFSELEKMKD
jgi:hypothetical protein